ncbi:unnamed protein product [Paramecium sonneborni]|uniref:WD-40 repeat protein n=1 Tax=Paramecium sonneborni TaxID=65129 RepID=A0A8S1RS17_9CILI|nr:unnamed protein product [Paramecium sonneborni]
MQSFQVEILKDNTKILKRFKRNKEIINGQLNFKIDLILGIYDLYLKFNIKVIEIHQLCQKIMNNSKNQQETLFDIVSNVLQVNKDIHSIIKLKNTSIADEGYKFEVFGKDIKIILNTLQNIKDNDINLKDFSSEQYLELKKDIMSNIEKNKNIRIKFTSLIDLLVELKADLSNQSWEYIRIRNTSLIGGTFVRCNLSGSQLDNVDINGNNFNGAQLLNCLWNNIKIIELNKLDGHRDYVLSVCISPDGKISASDGGDWDKNKKADNSIRLQDFKTGQLKAKLDGHTNTVCSVCFFPEGYILASGNDDKSIRLWNVYTGQQKTRLDGHKSTVYSVCFSPDGNTLASGSSNKSIHLWDIKTGQQKSKLNGHTIDVNLVCFSPNGNTLASGSKDSSIRLWDTKKEQQISKLDGHTDQVRSVCFSPDGNYLASGSFDNSLRLWDFKKEQSIERTDKRQKDTLAQFITPQFAKMPLQKGPTLIQSCEYHSHHCF